MKQVNLGSTCFALRNQIVCSTSASMNQPRLIHSSILQVFGCKSKCWVKGADESESERKLQGISSVITAHPQGDMNVWAKKFTVIPLKAAASVACEQPVAKVPE